MRSETTTLALLAMLAAGAAQAADAPAKAGTIAEAVTGGKAQVSFRMRYEDVDDAALVQDASALTLRSRLTWQSLPLYGVSATLEVDDIRAIVEDYNSTSNGRTRYPIVGDPEGTELNQASLRWAIGKNQLVGGRQRIVLDNHRFIGNVGWRQNEQTYDAVTLKTTALAKTALQYSYIQNVNRVSGPDEGSQPANYHGGVHALNGKVELGTLGALTGFGYLLDLDNAATLSSSTYGVHWAGAYKVSDTTKLNWIASYATQSDYADNPNDYDADYYLLEGGATFGAYGIKAGYEVLGGDTSPGHAFQTPLATLHAFQGWADKFLTTPAGGVEDLYVGGSATFGKLTLNLVWHDYKAEATDLDYGSEWNASAGWKFGKNYELLAKYADYGADDFATDTTKAWLQFSASF